MRPGVHDAKVELDPEEGDIMEMSADRNFASNSSAFMPMREMITAATESNRLSTIASIAFVRSW